MPASPAARFKQYLSERPNAETAAALATHHTMLWRLATGKRRPGLDLAFAIEALTRRWHGGQIRAIEWTTASIASARRKPLAAKPRARAAHVARTARAAR